MAVFKGTGWHKLVSEFSVCIILSENIRFLISGALAKFLKATIN
jgi:hypothetical protein